MQAHANRGGSPIDQIARLSDLHQRQTRQGPGGAAETRLALSLPGLAGRTWLRSADIGCGTGASTPMLAKEPDAHIVAVDFRPGFLKALVQRAGAGGLASRIETLRAGMGALPFQPASPDAVWAEGAICNIGFGKGVRAWRRFLKPGGIPAVSELTRLTGERPMATLRSGILRCPSAAGATTIIVGCRRSSSRSLHAMQVLKQRARSLRQRRRKLASAKSSLPMSAMASILRRGTSARIRASDARSPTSWPRSGKAGQSAPAWPSPRHRHRRAGLSLRRASSWM